MRHLVEGRKLGRTASHRRATMASLSIALIHERRIVTTVAKAKELRRFVEPLITRAKEDTNHNRRQVFAKLQDKYAVAELFEEIGPLSKDRPGGYTRVIRTGYRHGDSAEMAMIELVDFNDQPPEKREKAKKKTRRAGRSKKTTPAQPEPKKDESKSAEPKDEDVKAAEAADTEEQTAEEENIEEADSSEKKQETAGDYTVDEVKKKLESMSVEEARAFVGDDERVTVQRALDKKVEEASEE